ncbi:MAG: hypothetical protein ACK50J_13780 [Planctomyces sp.]
MTFRPRLYPVCLMLTAASLFVRGECAQVESSPEISVPEVPNVAMALESSRVDYATDDIQKPVSIRAEYSETTTFVGSQVQLMTGGVTLEQGGLTITADKLAVFSSLQNGSYEILVYAEDAVVTSHVGRQSTAVRCLRLQSIAAPQIVVAKPSTREVAVDNPLFIRAIEKLYPDDSAETHTVHQLNSDSFPPPSLAPQNVSSQGVRRIQVRPRSSQPIQFDMSRSTDTVPEEQIYVITGGVNMLIEGIEVDVNGQMVNPGVIDISADRVVAWTQPTDEGGLDSVGFIEQPADRRFQVYLEGNIVIRQGANKIEATNAFFDVNNDQALILNAELKTFIPTTQGYVRVRGERLRQLSRDRFHAQNAWVTTSPYGEPGYRVQATDIFFEPGQAAQWTVTDPLTGQQKVGQSTWVTSLNNQFIVGNTPVFWLPKISGPAEDPGIPLRRATVTQDSIFGLQVNTVWNMTRLLGLQKQPGVEWDLLLDYRTRRGPGLGTGGRYSGSNQYGEYRGEGTLYYQYDNGNDNLGLDRRRLNPDSDSRGEATWRHRQQLPSDALLFGEIGYLSDRNYLEQFHETRFDQDKDVETLLGIRQDSGAFSGMLWTRPDLNGFEATTDWLPRADLYSLSQPLLGGLAYWTSHSSAGYADMQQMQTPKDPNDPFTPLGLPYMTDASGTVAMSRHEIDAPFMLGPVKIDPYVMGEAAYWDKGFTNDSVDRYLLSAGVRARLFAWKVMPFVNSPTFNLRGLAHKHETMLEYAWTDVSRGINEIPQYNEIDENSQERFRTRYTNQIFPGVIPAEFNPRNYAIRNGAGLWATAPYHELAADQQVVRLSFRNRLQTKSGPLNSQRTRDWMVLESGLSFFPKSERDNFGEDIGLIYNHYRWNFSDRTSFLADNMLDLFENNQNIYSIGVLSQRSTRGSVYLGYRQMELDNYLSSRIVTGSYSYQMSEKWISTAAYAYDIAASESRGTSLTLSRVGLDFILHMGLGFDFSKSNVGIGVSLEPKFGPPSANNLGYLMGLQ